MFNLTIRGIKITASSKLHLTPVRMVVMEITLMNDDKGMNRS